MHEVFVKRSTKKRLFFYWLFCKRILQIKICWWKQLYLDAIAHLISGAQSGVWRGRPSGCTYTSLSLASRNEGSSGSYRTLRSHTVPRQTRISQGYLAACCGGLCRNFPPLRRPGREGRPVESRQMETAEKQVKVIHLNQHIREFFHFVP